MKAIYKTALACLMAAAATTGYAVNLGETTGEGPDGKYTWQFWCDYHTNDNTSWPNWQINFTPELTAAPAAVTYNYVLKKGSSVGPVAMTGAVNGGLGTVNSHAYAGPWTLDYDTEYVMETTVTVIYAGETNPNIFNFEPVTFKTPAEDLTSPKANITYTVDKNTMDYAIALQSVNETDVTEVFIGAYAGGQSEPTASATTLKGKLVVNQNGTFWVKGTVSYKDGEETKTINLSPNDFTVNFTAVTSATATLSVNNPQALSATTGSVDYDITISDPALFRSARIYCVKAGEILLGEKNITNADGLKGILELSDLNANANTEIWVKADITLTDGTTLQTLQYPGEAQGYTGLAIDTTNVSVEAIELAEGDAEYYSLQGVKVSADALQPGIYVVRKGNKTAKVVVK